MSLLRNTLFFLLLPVLAYGQAIHQEKVGFYSANKGGDNCLQTTLVTADAVATAQGRALFIPPTDRFGAPCQWVIDTDVTLTSRVFFAYDTSPVLKVDGGVTLTLAECPMTWGDYFIIDANGGTTGTVVYSQSCTECITSGANGYTKCTASVVSGIEDLSDNLLSDLQNVDVSANAAANQALMGDGTNYVGKTVPTCNATTGKLLWDSTAEEWECETDQGAGAVSLDTAFDVGKVIDGANSAANALQVGNGTVFWLLYCDGSNDCYFEKDTASDTKIGIKTNFNYLLTDEEGAGTMLTVDPDAANPNAMWQIGAGYEFSTTTEVILRPSGDCVVAEQAIITNDPIDEWITCADTTGDAVAFSYKVRNRTVADTTIQITLLAVNVNATPTGTFDLACAAQVVRPGTDIYAAHNTTGQQTVSFSTFDTQYRPEEATATFTVNGTLAAGAHVKGQCNVSAAPGQIADIRLHGTGVINLLSNSWSD